MVFVHDNTPQLKQLPKLEVELSISTYIAPLSGS